MACAAVLKAKRMNSMLVMTLATLSGLLIPTINGDRLRVTISASPPLNGEICVGETIAFTCHVLNSDHHQQYQYQWSIDEEIPTIGDHTYTIQVPSQSVFNVTCGVYARLNDTNNTTYGANTITVQPSGIIPQIYFQYVTHNFVFKLTRRPFNLTATVVSNSNLTSLYWSPPESFDQPSRTITVHHGNMTATTFMLLEDATLGDSGNYTLTAVNECGENSSQVKVEIITACPLPKFTEVQPAPNFTAVEGYNATMKCSYDGFFVPSSPLQMWALFPHSQKPVYLDEQPYFDCGCWVKHKLACPVNTDPNDCCRFEFIMHSTPRLHDSGTVFSCTRNFTKDDIAWMFVVPSPKVLEPPHNHTATVGSTAVFTCDFEASTDSKIAQIHWEFNGDDLAGCRRFQDRINCTVTQNSTGTNYISSTLEIYSVQADNAGQYTCYCSYDTSVLNVDGVQVIQSDHKSATLSVQSSSSHEKIGDIVIIIGIVFGALAIVLLLGSLIYCIKVYNQTHMGYISLEQAQSSDNEINDEILDRYVMEKLFPFWEKFGKALELPSSFLEKTYSAYPADPAERLRVILREWRATTDRPSVSTLNQTLKQLGLVNLIPH